MPMSPKEYWLCLALVIVGIIGMCGLIVAVVQP